MKPNLTQLKRKLLTTVFTLAALASSAQHLITGKVIDDNSRPVTSASIFLQQKLDKSILQTSISDTVGIFMLSPKETINYQLLVTADGFEAACLELPKVLQRDTVVLIRLTAQGKQLNQVSIYSKAPLIERKTDRIWFNVENSLSALGGDGIDALGKAPGVRVNDNGINIVGKSGIKVMVNDKLIQLSGADLISYVKSIPASNIKRIEIITNPSARYEAEGNSGLINIVLKKNSAAGFNGIINTGVILASKYSTGLTGIFNYNIDKLHISSNITGMHSEINGNALKNFFGAVSTWQRESNTLTNGKGIRGDLRIDYDISTTTTAGLKYMQGARSYSSSLEERGLFTTSSANRLDSTLLNTGNDKQKYDLGNFELYLDQKIDSIGKKIEFASNYFKYGTNNNNFFQSSTYSGEHTLLNSFQPISSREDEHLEIFTNKLDLTLPYKFANLEFGGKISSIKNNDKLQYQAQLAPGIFNDNIFDYSENTQALYGSADKAFKQWAIRLGLRMESTQTTGKSSVRANVYDNSYTQLFPTFYLKYNLNRDNILSFTYGRRINRPDYSFLNPARVYNAINVYSEGNPFLKPSFSNNFELNYNHNDWLNTSVYTNIGSNGFSTLNFFDTTKNIQSLVPGNYENSNSTGLSETVSFSNISWWESNNQFNFYVERSKSNGSISEGTIRQWSGYISTDNSFTLNPEKTLIANATLWYQFPEVYNRLISDAYYAVDLSLKAMFMDKRLTFAVNISDVFKTSQVKYSGVVNQVNQFNTRYFDNRKGRIAIIYRFGNSKANKGAKASDDTETSRVKQAS